MESLPKTDFVQSFNRRLRLNKCLSPFFQNFKAFLQRQAMSDDTWRFWIQFVFQDALAYVGLYLGIRSGDWQLRLANVKMKVDLPVFTAFDHPVPPDDITTYNGYTVHATFYCRYVQTRCIFC